jgi:hypothetical protein
MTRHKAEKLGSLFLAVFSTGLSVQLAVDGMQPMQWLGASLAVAGSLALVLTVHAWPQPAEATRRR